MEMRWRGGPSLTPPRSPHSEAGLTVDHHPHGRRGWVDVDGYQSCLPPCPEVGPQLGGGSEAGVAGVMVLSKGASSAPGVGAISA